MYGDSTRSFVDLCLRPSEASTATVSHSQLHTWYVAYCYQHGYTPLGQSKFIAHLRTILPRHYIDRAWSPQVNGQRSRVPAHWHGLAPLPQVFVSSGGGSPEFPENPQWVCIKAQCVEGGIEAFELHWNPPESSLPATPEPLPSAGVHPVHPQILPKTGGDSLKPLPSAGVHPGSTVHSEGIVSNFELEIQSSLQQDEATILSQREATILDRQPQGGPSGQGGQADVEPVSANLEKLDSLDRVDKVNRAVAMMQGIDSVESFQSFYELFQRCSEVWQQRMMDAFATQVPDPVVQEQFYYWWGEFEAVSQQAECAQAGSPATANPAGPTVLCAVQLAAVLQVLAGINSVATVERFNLSYNGLSEAEQRQIWAAARPEWRASYEYWSNELLLVPEIVWEARQALWRIFSPDGVKAVRQQFDRDTLNWAYQLVHPDVQRQLQRWIRLAQGG